MNKKDFVLRKAVKKRGVKRASRKKGTSGPKTINRKKPRSRNTKAKAVSQPVRVIVSPDGYKASGEFIVKNKKGLHTRPSTALVTCATNVSSRVSLRREGSELETNAKSVLEVLIMGAHKDTKVRVEAEGNDSEKAVNAIILLAGEGFNMQY